MSDIYGGASVYQGDGVPANVGRQGLVRWTFYDEVTGESYTFDNNPHDASPLPFSKTVTPYALSADDGNMTLYEGMDTPQVATFTVSVLTPTFYQALVYWYGKRRPILMTDDIGNALWVYFTLFTPTRKWTYQHPFSHDVQMSYYVVGQQVVQPQ